MSLLRFQHLIECTAVTPYFCTGSFVDGTATCWCTEFLTGRLKLIIRKSSTEYKYRTGRVLWERLHERPLLRLPQQHLCLYLVKLAELGVLPEPLVEQQLRHEVAHCREHDVRRIDRLPARLRELLEQEPEALADRLLRRAALQSEIFQSAQCKSTRAHRRKHSTKSHPIE